MSAKIENKYAEKWTKQSALKFLDDSLELLKGDTNIYFIGTLANKMGSYRDIYTYLTKKYEHNHKVFRTIKKTIDSVIESRLFEKGFIDGAAMAIFGLKNNHEWKDKSEIEQTNRYDIDGAREKLKKILDNNEPKRASNS